MLDYAPDLRAITGGQGEYSMDLARYEECPSHVAQQVMQQAEREKEAVKA
jgi:elongation factor G